MSVDSLKKLYSIAWVDEKHNPNTFGPPAFDESFSTYTWRVFKRGFSWGKKITITQKIRLYVDNSCDGAIPIRDVFNEGHGWAFSICASYAATRLWSASGDWLRVL